MKALKKVGAAVSAAKEKVIMATLFVATLPATVQSVQTTAGAIRMKN